MAVKTLLRCFTQPQKQSGETPENASKFSVRAGDYPNERFKIHYQAASSAVDWSSYLDEHADPESDDRRCRR